MTWAQAIAVFSFSVVCIACTDETVPPNGTGSLDVREDPHDSETLIFDWRGSVDPPMARLFEDAFSSRPQSIKRVVVHLHSPGGRLDEGQAVINVIERAKKEISVRTYVGPQSECLSMCVPIYMRGSLRIAASTSQWMFHEPQSYDALTGHAAISYGTEQKQSEMNAYNQFWKGSGVDETWLQSTRSQWAYGDVWKSGEELKREGANIVMVLERP